LLFYGSTGRLPAGLFRFRNGRTLRATERRRCVISRIPKMPRSHARVLRMMGWVARTNACGLRFWRRY